MAKEETPLLSNESSRNIPWDKVVGYGSLASIPSAFLQGIFTFAGVRKNQYNGFQAGFLNIGPPPPNPGPSDHPALSLTATEVGINLGTSVMIMWMMYHALKTGRTVLFFLLGMTFAIFDLAFTSSMSPYMSADAGKSARYEGYLAGNISDARYSNPYSFWDGYPSSLLAQTGISGVTALVTCFVALFAGYKIAHLILRNRIYELSNEPPLPSPP